MKAHFLAAFSFFVFTAGCRKDDNRSAPGLHRKWQVYSIKVLQLDDRFNQGACGYQTKASDLFGPPTVPSCQDDDVYDFTDRRQLTVYSGPKKCTAFDPGSSTKRYEQRGDSLFIEGTSYRIVHLSGDTLVLDYCTGINTYPTGTGGLNQAKIGMKFTGAN